MGAAARFFNRLQAETLDVRGANLVAGARVFGGFVGMGAKYYPTVKDQKANQRFLQKQRAQVKPKKVPDVKPEPKGEKK
jgi:hypothetical protein